MTDSTPTKVITAHLREEAQKWRDLSERMDAVNRDPVGNDGLKLEWTAFFIGPTEMVPTMIHSRAYNEHYEYAKKLIAGAVVEWEQLGRALDRMADEFDRTDQTVKADLEKIYTEPDRIERIGQL